MSRLIDRTGETATTNCGLKVTITSYRNNKDIDVIFENGSIVRNAAYCNFKNGEMFCPMVIERENDYFKATNLNVNPAFSFLIDEIDLDIVKSAMWHSCDGYANGKIDHKNVILHRVIVGAEQDEKVDHINHNITDNRRCNLRRCTHAENLQNMKMPGHNTSGYKGVSWSNRSNAWRAQIMADRQKVHLGFFDNKLDAAKAYDEAAIKYYGEYALINGVPARKGLLL